MKKFYIKRKIKKNYQLGFFLHTLHTKPQIKQGYLYSTRGFKHMIPIILMTLAVFLLLVAIVSLVSYIKERRRYKNIFKKKL